MQANTNHLAGIKTVLVVLSSRGMTLDLEALRHQVTLSYPGAAVFFLSTSGKSLGIPHPDFLDLIIDLTARGERQPGLFPRKMRKAGKFIVGRKHGFLRRRMYDRLLNERKIQMKLPEGKLHREHEIQKLVFDLAGIPLVSLGAPTADFNRVMIQDSGF